MERFETYGLKWLYNPEKDSKGYNYKLRISRLPGSRRRFKLTFQILRVIGEHAETDDETTASQLA